MGGRIAWGWRMALPLVALLAMACGQVAGPSPTATPAPDQGAALYRTHCLSCHGDRDGAGRTPAAPPHGPTGHTWHHPDAQLLDWVLNGKPPGAMPAFKDKLSPAEARAILAYIKTWWTEEQRETQADVSRRYQEALERD